MAKSLSPTPPEPGTSGAADTAHLQHGDRSLSGTTPAPTTTYVPSELTENVRRPHTDATPISPGSSLTRPSLPPIMSILSPFENQESPQPHRPLVSQRPLASMAQTASNLSGHAHPAPPPPATSTGPKKQEPKKAPRKAPRAKKQKITHDRPLPSLAPAPPRPQPLPQVEQLILDTNLEPPKPKDIYDLPAEIRVEIYKLVLDDVVVHVIPSKSENDRFLPHALVRTSRVVRNEVLPIMHATCAIQVEITNFNFTGLMQFMKRIPPDDHKYLVQNDRLCIHLNTTQKEAKGNSTIVGDSASLRNWLSWRADTCKPQARWEYDGPYPGRKVDSELKRRVKRMTEVEKKGEMIKMVEAIGVVIPENQSER